MRFLLDSVYVGNPIQSQLGKIVNACPTLMLKFLGASAAAKTNPLAGNAETAGSLFTRVRGVGPLKRIPTAMREADYAMLKRCWERVYKVTVLPSMKFRLDYYNKLKVQYEVGQRARRFGVSTGEFVVSRSKPRSFFQIKRVATLGVDTIIRLFIVVQPYICEEDGDGEASYAPYDVFTIDPNAALQALSINEVEAMCVHMVQKTRNSWWWNPYVTDFI